MIEADLIPFVGERVEIWFPACRGIRATVRWVRAGRFGVEFAEATGLPLVLCASKTARPCGRRHGEAQTPPPQPDRAPRRSVGRQCELFWGSRSQNVHLRNVSAEGAMVSGGAKLARGTEVVLALKCAGTVFDKVVRSRGGRLGLSFDSPFELRKLEPPPNSRRGPGRGAPAGGHAPLSQHRDRRGFPLGGALGPASPAGPGLARPPDLHCHIGLPRAPASSAIAGIADALEIVPQR